MIFNEKRIRQYKASLGKIPGKLAALRLALKTKYQNKNPNLIAIRIDGGLGDYIIAARFTRDLLEEIPEIEFDIFCKKIKIASWIFSIFPQCKNVLDAKMDKPFMRHRYALKINCLTFLSVTHDQTDNPKLRKLAELIRKDHKKIRRLTDQHPYLDGYLGQYATLKGKNRLTFAGGMAGIAYSGDRLPLPNCDAINAKHKLEPKKYITISNGYDLEAVQYTKPAFGATKVYPHFGDLLEMIKIHFPDIAIVQVGNESSTHLASADLNLVGKTSLSEVAGILKNSLLHIDNEGGLVHLARCFETKCCVVFGPTDIDYFGYPDNINIPPIQCGNCWWMEETWMSQCVKGDPTPKCMFNQPPLNVFKQVQTFLSEA